MQAGPKPEAVTQSEWIFYDGRCPACLGFVKKFRQFFPRRRFVFVPLQTPKAEELLGLPEEKLFSQLWVLTAGGKRIGGADALIYLAGKIWWAWPMALLLKIPAVRLRLAGCYCRFARHRKLMQTS